ncbi:hypothetical protein AUK40_03530 [Candidatus Wirthbacteria bacterium CG2_30_54_11]|uniref:AMP-dependent synthetase/ligase domain-containing protein n=1 Tax=Candidatus Wirthbacteria bacterium CG2_30_54_11 TaxID=1817892 RepID=A0A1J5IJF2_9BACT|nr:MAG: hypothetical protein AUK40_03530 [Candidatus Wirthbacteria bacterium CG2_30_54_11]
MSLFDKFYPMYYRSFEDRDSTKHLLDFYYSTDIDHLIAEYRTYNSVLLKEKAKSLYLDFFHFIAERVPAYKDFLRLNGVDHTKIVSSDDMQRVPWVNKKNYLGKYAPNELCVDGSLRSNGLVALSSGSSGQPFSWPRGGFQDVESNLTAEVFLKDIFEIDKYKTLVINCFSMGMYVAGLHVTNMVIQASYKGYDLLVATPGLSLSDIDKVLREASGPYDQIILAGYPPFVKDVVDYSIAHGFSWSKRKLRFLFAAEGFSEKWRENIITSASQDFSDLSISLNMYGSADSLILGHETPISICAKRILESNDQVSTAVIGSTRTCTLIQYNPLMRFFEKENNELIFSSFAGIPLVRYNIHDEGGLFTHNELYSQFLKIGVDLHNELRNNNINNSWKLPFLYLFGKSDSTISYYGLKIFPENIKAALESDQLKQWATGKFRMQVKDDNNGIQKIIIAIELGFALEPSVELVTIFSRELVVTLRQKNSEYNRLYESLGEKSLPLVKLFPKGSGLFSNDVVKQKCVM